MIPNFTSSTQTYARESEQVTYTKPTQDDVVGLITHYALKYDIDPKIPLAVGKAESGYKNVPNFKYDGEGGRYTAYGIFQFTRTTWKGFCTPDPADRMDIEKNVECGVRMMSEGHIKHWNESKHMWVDSVEPLLKKAPTR